MQGLEFLHHQRLGEPPRFADGLSESIPLIHSHTFVVDGDLQFAHEQLHQVVGEVSSVHVTVEVLVDDPSEVLG